MGQTQNPWLAQDSWLPQNLWERAGSRLRWVSDIDGD
jgi:hypothetical protein